MAALTMERSWARMGLADAAYTALASGLAASDLWSLLLGVIEQRAAQRTATTVKQQWEHDRFVSPAYIDQRTLNALDGHLLANAVQFEALELSPLAPLGACSAIGLASQNKIVSTIRGTEVVSDPTNVLALESARRLAQNPTQIFKFATSHRCVRAQPIPKGSGYAAHFRMFCMSTAGHEQKDHGLLVEALTEHIRTHLSALDLLEQNGYAFPGRSITILATPAREPLGRRVASAAGVPAVFRTLEHDYYDGLRFMINAGSIAGESIPLIDGGAFNWLGKLTANQKNVFVGSAMGAQLAAYLFRRSTAEEPVLDGEHGDG
jgi:hypothetical protein